MVMKEKVLSQIKGSIINGSIERLKTSAGENAYYQIVDLLDTEWKDMFLKPFSSSGWYFLDVFTNYLDVLVAQRLGGYSDGLIRETEKVVEKQFNEIYSVFVKKDSPEFLLKKMTALHAMILKGVDVEPTIIAPGKGKVKYFGFEKKHTVFEPCLIGFYRKAATIYGAKNVNVEMVTRIAHNKGYTELDIIWEE